MSSSSPEDSCGILPSPDQIHPDPSLDDDDGGGLLNRSMSRDPPPPKLNLLGWLGKCGDYKNKRIRRQLDEMRRKRLKMRRKHYKAIRWLQKFTSAVHLHQMWRMPNPRLLEPWPIPWISRDENGDIKIINLNDRKEGVNITIKQISRYLNNHTSNSYSTNSIFPVNQIMTSKISEYIRCFGMDKNQILCSQCGFAVIDFITEPPILIGPFKPVNINKKKKNKLPDIIHTEDQCISGIEVKIKGKEQMIKAIYIFTTNNPCSDRKDHDACMIQLARFSEKMISFFKIKVYIVFQDSYGLSGSLVDELKELSCEQDSLIMNTLSRLRKTVIEEHRGSKFVCFQGGKKHKNLSKTIKTFLKTGILKSPMIIKVIDSFKITFPPNEMTLDEFKKFGEEQAHEMKQIIELENQTKISEIVYSLFYHKWCVLVDEEYEEFIYKKLSDRINTFAVRFVNEDMEGILPCFNLIRVKLPQ
ncbi:uncharacterized protein [Garra rufa]|uniref:uncharacterized protein n=1 Tax=Garra rufa TaxID=137080 RepID=UPI003CCEA063